MVFGGCFGSGTRGFDARAGMEPTTTTTTTTMATTKRTMEGRLASTSNRSARAEAHALERQVSRSGGGSSQRRSKSKRSKTKRKDKRNAGTLGSEMYSGSESEGSLDCVDGDDGGFGSESSGRAPDFGIDRATYRANVANGVETNAALREWLKRREMWRNAGRNRTDGEGKQATSKKMSIPRAASYDTLLGYDRPSGAAFKRPIRLADMVFFLNDCWAEGEGL